MGDSMLRKRLAAVVIVLIIGFCVAQYFDWQGFLKPLAKDVLWIARDENRGVYQRVLDIRSWLEKASEQPLKYDAVNISGGFFRAVGKNYIEENDVLRLNNGYLTFPLRYSWVVDDIAEKTLNLKNALEERGVNLLFVLAPAKPAKYDVQTPLFIKDYANDNADRFLEKLDGFGVSYFDLREEMKNDGIAQYDMFFRTDHHWKPEAGLWAARKTSERLNADFGYNINTELLDIKNYETQTYKEWFLGSQGKRVGVFQAPPDDFNVITPKFATDFKFDASDWNVHREGVFQDAMFDISFLDKDLFKMNTYAMYTGSDYPLNTIENRLYTGDDGGKRIVMLRDSFGCVFAPFFAVGLPELYTIDLRANKQDDMFQYILDLNPETVVILYNAGDMNAPEMFEITGLE